jgi:hypothetical protein
MAEKSSLPSSVYAFDDEAANKKYQDAYNQLISAIDARQEKPAFDPTWLAAAQGFLAPKKTGSFFESLGNVAGNVAKAQEAEQNRALETAKARLDLAGMGIQQANQRAAMQMYQDGAAPSSAPPSAPPSAPGSAPSAGAMEPSPSDFTLKSMGIDEAGVQLFPPQPLVPEKQFVASELLKGGNVPDAKIKYQEYLRKDIDTTQNGLVIQRSTGRAFEMPDPTPANVPFLSLQGEPFPTTKFFARKLDALTQANDNEGRIALENKIRGIGQRPPAPVAPHGPLQVTPMPAAAGIVNAPRVATITTPRPLETAPETPPPSALPPAAPQAVGMRPPSEIERAKQEEAARRAVQQARDTAQAQAEVAQGAKIAGENVEDVRKTIVEIKKTARGQANIADQMAKLVTEYPNAIGTASKPGFLSAGIKLLESGANIGGESAKASALEEAVATLKGTSEELSARRVMMGLAAEYLFSLRALQKGQGTITDFETRVLQSIGPSLQDDAKTARFKTHVMKMHAEAEIDRVNEFNDWQKKNKGLGWRDYLGSTDHDKFATNYDKKLGLAYDTYLGRKPQQASAQPSKPASNPALDFARSLK